MTLKEKQYQWILDYASSLWRQNSDALDFLMLPWGNNLFSLITIPWQKQDQNFNIPVLFVYLLYVKTTSTTIWEVKGRELFSFIFPTLIQYLVFLMHIKKKFSLMEQINAKRATSVLKCMHLDYHKTGALIPLIQDVIHLSSMVSHRCDVRWYGIIYDMRANVRQ